MVSALYDCTLLTTMTAEFSSVRANKTRTQYVLRARYLFSDTTIRRLAFLQQSTGLLTVQTRKSSSGSSKSDKKSDISDKDDKPSERIIVEVVDWFNAMIRKRTFQNTPPVTAASPLWYTHGEEEYAPSKANEKAVD